MKKLNLFVLCLIFSLKGLSQKTNTHALVIGISAYEEISPLDYAHRDAEAFAVFLQSANGGNVPKENITLLLNKDATIAAISLALEHLLEITEKNDTVFIYFSGHGDVDLNLAHDPGFLLAYDTPKGHYLKNAIEIESFNNYIVNTLSVKKEATVIVITDACHSGKIAEKSFNNSSLAAEQLRNVRTKEIRLSSCAADQLSQEDERWGDGRGVFSYYLIKGLNGEAEKNITGFISLGSVRNYLDRSLANDPILKEKKGKQTPVFNGNKEFLLNKPVQQTPGSQIITTQNNNGLLLEKPLAAVFFDQLQKFSIENIFDYSVLDNLSSTQIASYCIDKIADTAQQLIQKNTFLNYTPFDLNKAGSLKDILSQNSYQAKQFNQKLAQLFSDKGQNAINAYLKGDVEELEKRKYYNLKENNYEAFPKMFSTALKLLKAKEGNPTELEKQLQIKQYYFSGIVERLKLPLIADKKPILQKAIKFQLKALALEEDSDFLQNELGLLYYLNKEYEKAETAFNRATSLNPNWALPWSNLAGLYVDLQKPDSGLVFAEKAIVLQPNYSRAYLKQGMLYEQKNNLLAAEELYKKCISIQFRDFRPFEKLGEIYLQTGDFKKADRFFYEAELRKKGFPFLPDEDGDGVINQFDAEPPVPNCSLIQNNINPSITDGLSNMAVGLEYLFLAAKSDPVLAERYFRIAIQCNPKNHIAYHYLGKALFIQNRWLEAEMNLQRAARFFIPDAQYDQYTDSLLTAEQNPNAVCIRNLIKPFYYPREGDIFCMGDNYIAWGQYQQAEIQFRKAITINKQSVSGYYKLWNLLMAQGKYHEAEMVFITYYNLQKEPTDLSGIEYLASFYDKTIELFPDNPYWLYKAGSFYFSEIKNPYFPEWQKEEFASHMRIIQTKENGEFDDEKEPGKIDKILSPDIESKEQFILIPGKMTVKYRGNGIPFATDIPGTNEIRMEAPDIQPWRKSYDILQKTVLLFQDNEDILADIYYKLGTITELVEQNQPAMEFFQKASFFNAGNINHTMKFIENAIASFNYRKALVQLDSLSLQKKLNTQLQLTRCSYLMLAGRTAESKIALQNLMELKDTILPVTDLKFKLAFLKKDNKTALTQAFAYLKDHPDDKQIHYTIAHLFAKQFHKKESFSWLQKSLKKGFPSFYLLNADPVWDTYKNTPSWQEIVKRRILIKYPAFEFNDLKE